MIAGMASRTGTQTPQQISASAHDATAELLGDPVLGGGYDRIVHRVFKIDPFDDYVLVERCLEAKGNDFGTLVDALDHAETGARAAHRLLVNAQLAYEQTKLEVARIESPLREGARKHLEDQKGSGERKKAITNDDVESAMAQLFPEDVAKARERLLKARGTVEHLERLADLAKSRIRTLDTLVSTARR